MKMCETRLQKGSISINGLKKKENENIYEVVKDFLKDQLKIEKGMPLRTAYRLNKFKVTVQFVDPNDVAVVFGNVKHLKGVKKEDDRYFRVDEMMPDHQYEQKRRIKDIKRENGRMPFTHQSILTTEKGAFYIGEGEDKHKWIEDLKPPLAKDYLLRSKKGRR